MIGSANDEGHFNEQVEYDLTGEALRVKFTTLFVTRYGKDKLFSKRGKEIKTALDRAKVFKQGAATDVINKELPVMEKICKHWCISGHQTNVVRLLVSDALGARIDKCDISQFVRANVFNDKMSPWNGVASGDKKYNAIRQAIF